MTFEKIRDMIAEKLGKSPESITPESEITKDLGADSLDQIDLMLALEDNFGITVSDEDSEKIVTVQDIVNLIDNK